MLKFQSAALFFKLARLPRKVITCITPMKFGWGGMKTVEEIENFPYTWSCIKNFEAAVFPSDCYTLHKVWFKLEEGGVCLYKSLKRRKFCKKCSDDPELNSKNIRHEKCPTRAVNWPWVSNFNPFRYHGMPFFFFFFFFFGTFRIQQYISHWPKC